MACSFIQPYLIAHSIAGTAQGRQGAGQTVPEHNVLCMACGWMTTSTYMDHLIEIVDDYIEDVI